MSYEQLREKFPRQFQLELLDPVFKSWNNVFNDSFHETPLDIDRSRMGVIFEHDQHVYSTEGLVSYCWGEQNVPERVLNIDLPNNGLIYPNFRYLHVYKPEEEEKKLKTNPSSLSCYVTLDLQHLKQFPYCLDFSKRYLQASIVRCQLAYDFIDNKFIFRAFKEADGNDSVCITSQEMDNVDHEYLDGYWLKSGSDEQLPE